MTFQVIMAFILAHWHKVVATVALFMALYNKYSHDKMVSDLVAQMKPSTTPAPAPVPTKHPKKHSKKHHKKNK